MRHANNTHTTIDSPLGTLMLVAHDRALSGVYFPGHWHLPDPATFGNRSDAGFEEARRQLTEYFAGRRSSFELPTATAGNTFQKRVWKLIDDIPYGRTTTYGDLARELGDASQARAVGAAVGRNPLSVIVPCHRVVGKGGKLTGYAGGLERKRFLLDLEALVAVGAGPYDSGALGLDSRLAATSTPPRIVCSTTQ
jgi:methylated-DNA-[protein]-cysteine S-methyltransferase